MLNSCSKNDKTEYDFYDSKKNIQCAEPGNLTSSPKSGTNSFLSYSNDGNKELGKLIDDLQECNKTLLPKSLILMDQYDVNYNNFITETKKHNVNLNVAVDTKLAEYDISKYYTDKKSISGALKKYNCNLDRLNSNLKECVNIINKNASSSQQLHGKLLNTINSTNLFGC